MSRLVAGAILAFVGGASVAVAVVQAAPGPSPVVVSEEGPPPPPPPKPDKPPAPPPPPGSDRPPGHNRRKGAEDAAPAAISGRVVASSGNPIPPFLRVWARGSFPEKWDRRRALNAVKVANDGTFRLEHLPSGWGFDVMAGFITSGEIGHLEGAVAGTENALVTLESWGGTIRGRVLDGAGEPVGAGVAVNAGKFERGLCGTRGRGYDSGTRTRDDGSYFIEFLTSGDFTVTAYREAAGKKESARADLVPEGSTEVELRLGPTPREPRESLERPAPDRSRYRPAMTSISGRVVRPEGTEWPEWLTVEFLSIGGKVCKAVYVDKNGVFDTGTMEPGTYTVRAVSGSGLECGARAGVESGSRDVEIAIGSHGSITGQVFLPDGAPAGAGLYVHALVTGFPKVPHFPGNSGSTRTREDGTFRIDFLGEGAFSLRAVPGERRGLLSSWPVDDIRPDTKGLALRLVESAAIAGVLLAADGAPCHPCEIRAVQEGRGEGECVRTNTKGVFNFTKIAAGKFRVLANPRVDEHRNDGQKWPSIDLGEFESPATDLRLELPRE